MADKEEKDRQNTDSEEESTADKGVNVVSGLANNAVDSVKDIASNTTSKVSEELGVALEKTTEMLSNPSVLYGLIAVIVIAIICVAVVYYFIANAVFNKKSIIIEKTATEIIAMTKLLVTAAKIIANDTSKADKGAYNISTIFPCILLIIKELTE